MSLVGQLGRSVGELAGGGEEEVSTPFIGTMVPCIAGVVIKD